MVMISKNNMQNVQQKTVKIGFPISNKKMNVTILTNTCRNTTLSLAPYNTVCILIKI